MPAPLVAQIAIKVNGTDLSIDTMKDLFDVEVETSLYLPSMFSMRFYDDKVTLIDGITFKEGNPVEISTQTVDSTT